MGRPGAALWTLVALLGGGVFAAAPEPPTLFPEPLSERVVAYDISVRLDAEKHLLTGKERVEWRNLTGDTVSEVRLHLYLNAFANDSSLFMRESRGQHRGFEFDEESWGYCEVTSASQESPEGGSVPLVLTYPAEDLTVAAAILPHPVPPGGTALLDLEFRSQLPRVFARSGWEGDFFMVGQWFPKLGVYEEGRGWNCHPYHLNSEFFADFGTYDVEITLPSRFVVGATGVPWERTENKGMATHRYRAEDIHDFAWTAYPKYIEVKDRWVRDGREVELVLLMLPGNLAHAPRYAKALKAAMDWTAERFEPYPYPRFTLVDAPIGGATGMEYPTLATMMTHPAIPASVPFPEVVVVHEFAHEYFYGICASNEFEEPWLDEGFTSYCEMRILESMFGEERSALAGFGGWTLSSEAEQRMGYASLPNRDPLVLPSWEYEGNGSYSVITYYKASLVLRTLENLLGRARFDALLGEYYRAVRFTHPTTADFERTFLAVAGQGYRPLLREMLYGTGTVDFEVASVRRKPLPAGEGYEVTDGRMVLKEKSGKTGKESSEKAKKGEKGKKEKDEKEKEAKSYLSEITLQRHGELVLPVEVRLTFAGGAVRTERWDGTGRWKRFAYTGPKVVKVEVDPGGKVALDTRRLNNGWQAEVERLPARSLLTRARILVQGIMVALLTGL